MQRFLLRIGIHSVAIYFIAQFVPGIEIKNLFTALGAGLVLALINAVVRPLLIVLTLPLTVLSLGLFLFILNAICLKLAASLVKGFIVDGFWPALFGAFLISLVSWLLGLAIQDPPLKPPQAPPAH